MDSVQTSAAVIKLEDLRAGYGKRTLIDGASVEIRRGRLTALIGRNGTGKSTLLRIIAGLEDPQGGEVVIEGRRLREIVAEERARMIAVVTTRRVRVADMLCRDVVGLGRTPYTNWIGRMSDDDERMVMESLSLVGMAEYAGRAMDTLSDGEYQRVMIARALAQDTPIILLDEPTSFLDMPGRYELALLLKRLTREGGKTVVFSTHELDIAMTMADDVALIAPPRLIVESAERMREGGEVNRLFVNSDFVYSAEKGGMVMKGM